MTAQIQIRMLGTPTVQGHNGPATLGARAQALLYVLAAAAPTGRTTQTRPALAGLLWGEAEEELARMNLRKALVDLRKVVGDQLESDYQTVALKTTGCWIDLVEFKQTAKNAATLDLARLQRGLDLYQGDLLAGFYLRNAPDFESWLLNERTHYRELALSALHTLADRQAQQGDLAQAIVAIRRLLALEPWREEAHRSLMGWLAQSGQRSAALAQYGLCRRLLANELAVEPQAETVALYEAIRAGKLDGETRQEEAKGKGASKPVRPDEQETSETGKNRADVTVVERAQRAAFCVPHSSLPPQSTPFIGRQQEVADVVQRLADPACRLLTLVGPGGMGKTRLALEAAKEIADCGMRNAELTPQTIPRSAFHNPQCPDGIFFVPLAAVSTASAIVAAIAEAVGFAAYDNMPAQQQLLNHLRDKHLWLVLDNFEHLLAGVDLVVELLNAAPGVKLLVTSRELLNLREEWLYTISGLAIPAAATDKVDELIESDAVRLFVQCAQRARPAFDLAAEWRCVLRICHLVEGMPLGIELAATWLKILPCAQIAAEIQRNLDFLTSRMHNIPQRHRSMRAVFEHSWQLLGEEERTVLARLAQLAGFDQAAANQVAGATLFTLTTLLEKSMLRVNGNGRYTIHELVRQFAQEKLQADPGAQALIEARRSDYYLALLQYQMAARKGAQQRQALATLGEELENVRAAWLWAAAQDQLARLDPCLDDLYAFYTLSHRYQEGVELCEATLQTLTPTSTESEEWIVRKLLNRLGGFYTNLGVFARAQTLLTAGLTLSRTLGLVGESIFCLRVLGEVAGWQGNFSLGKAHLDEALALSEAAGDQEGAAYTLARLTDFALGLNDHPTVKKLCEQYLAVGRQLDNNRFVIHALRLLAFNAFALGEYAATTAYCQEGLQLAEELNDHLELSIMLVVYMHNGAVTGTLQPIEAKQLAEQAFALVQNSGQPYYIAMVLYLISQTLGELNQHELAEQYGKQGLLIARSANVVALVAGSLAVLGDLYCQQKEFAHSRRYLHEALQTGITGQILLLTLEALVYYAGLLAAEGKQSNGVAAETKQIQAVELLTLAHHHPVCMQIFKQRASRLLAELYTVLPPALFAAAQAHGQQLTLDAAVAEILRSV